MSNEAPSTPEAAPAAPPSAPAPAPAGAPANLPAPSPAPNAPAAGQPSLLGAAGVKPPEPPKPGDAPKPGEVIGALGKFEELKLPEGVTVDAPAAEKFMAIATEHKLSREVSQKLLDIQVEREVASAKANSEAFDSTVNAWRDETKRVLGKDYAQAESDAGRFIETCGSPELRKVLDLTKLGENVHVFKAFAKAGAMLGEDKLAGNRPGSGSEKTLAQKFYPNSVK